MTTITSLYVKILGDSTGLQRSLAQSSASLKTFSSAAQTSTGAVTKSTAGLTAGLVGVAVAAKAAADFTAFQATMTRTVTLAGATEEQMHAASEEILNVSAALGQGPQELAEALYFTESAGIDAAHAMDVVKVAAKASAVGLGETEVIADALTSVLNAYGEENISAAQAADILTAAVRDGKGEADAIAGAIGRVIPVASEMGVGFDQVAAGIAAMTRTGLDANEAVTALRGTLTAMLNPTEQAKTLLEGVGVSSDSLRASIADNGLLATLQELQQRFEGNDEAFGQLFGNVRAQVGVLSLLGNNAGEVGEVFRDVAASGGTLNEAFALVQETSQFKLQQAFAAIQVALVEVGGAIAPVVVALAEILKVIAPLLPALAGLGAGFLAFKAYGFVLAFLQSFKVAVIAAAGSSTAAAGGVTALGVAFKGLVISAAPLLAFAAAAYAVVKAVSSVSDYLKMDDVAAQSWTESILAGKASLEDYRVAVQQVTGETGFSDKINGDQAVLDAFDHTVQAVQQSITEQNQAILEGTPLYGAYGAALDSTTNANLRQHATIATLVRDLYEQQGTLDSVTAAAVQSKVAHGDLAGAIHLLRNELGPAAGSMSELTAQTEAQAEAARAAKLAEQQLAGGLLGLVASLDQVSDQQKELAALRADGKRGTEEYRDAQLSLLQSQLSVTDGLRDYMATLTESGRTQDFAISKVVALGAQVGLTRGEVLDILGPLDQYKARLNDIPANVRTKVEAQNIDGTINQLQRLNEVISNIDGRTITVQEVLIRKQHTGGMILHDGGGVLETAAKYHSGNLASDEVPAILQRGEYVIQRSAVQKIGVHALDQINRMHAGGPTQPGESPPIVNVEVWAQIFERAIRRASANLPTSQNATIPALIRHSEISTLLELMGTSVKAFTKDIRAALNPDGWKDFAQGARQAIQSDDWQSFSSSIKEVVGAHVWRDMADEARRAFESGDIQRIAQAVKDALQTEEWKEFARTVRQDAASALRSFHDAAVDALDFTSDAFSTLESTASSALSQLKGDTDLSAGALFDLRQEADLTGREVLEALEKSARQTRLFARDLLEISKIGGDAGKALAAELLASGNILTAAAIADAPAALQRKIVAAFAEASKAADNLATKLTRRIAGTLRDIEKILKAIAKKWDVDLQVHTSGGAHHAGGAILHSGGMALRSDEVPAILQRGEYVIQRSAVQTLGVPTLDILNRLHEGGPTPSLMVANTPAGKPQTLDLRAKLAVDRRTFSRSLDYAEITDGYW